MGTKVPGYERSQELSFSGNESSRERKGPGTKVLSFHGTFIPGEQKFPGTKGPGTFVPPEWKFSIGTFRSWERKVLGTKVCNSKCCHLWQLRSNSWIISHLLHLSGLIIIIIIIRTFVTRAVSANILNLSTHDTMIFLFHALFLPGTQLCFGNVYSREGKFSGTFAFRAFYSWELLLVGMISVIFIPKLWLHWTDGMQLTLVHSIQQGDGHFGKILAWSIWSQLWTFGLVWHHVTYSAVM